MSEIDFERGRCSPDCSHSYISEFVVSGGSRQTQLLVTDMGDWFHLSKGGYMPLPPPRWPAIDQGGSPHGQSCLPGAPWPLSGAPQRSNSLAGAHREAPARPPAPSAHCLSGKCGLLEGTPALSGGAPLTCHYWWQTWKWYRTNENAHEKSESEPLFLPEE